MKFLFDQNISFRITKKLLDHFPDCKHISDCGLENKKDVDIWNYAFNNNFSIVTFDSDFYDISIINGHPPKIIWLRTGNLTTNTMAKLLISKKTEIHSFLYDVIYKEVSCMEIE